MSAAGAGALNLHHLNDSRSQRIAWLLEELGLSYELTLWQRDPKTLSAPAELARVHPLGKAPVLIDGSRVLVESGAIVEHLLRIAPSGATLAPAPGSAPEDAYRQWLHFAEGSAMPPLVLKLIADAMPKASMPSLARPIARQISEGIVRAVVMPDLERQLAWMDQSLAQSGPWFAGQAFTAADVMMSFPVQTARALVGLDGRPQLQDWLARIEEREAWKRAVERTGGFDLTLPA